MTEHPNQVSFVRYLYLILCDFDTFLQTHSRGLVVMMLVFGMCFLMVSNVIMTESWTDDTTTWNSTNYLSGNAGSELSPELKKETRFGAFIITLIPMIVLALIMVRSFL